MIMHKLLVVGLLFFALQVSAEEATFAGGCFWCIEAAYQDLEGVSSAVSGFTGGTLKNPTYRGDHRGHFEAVKIEFDPDVISYKELLAIFWHNIDPFDNRGQFCDKGFSYRSAIFPVNEKQRNEAIASLSRIGEQFHGETIYTEIRDASSFWPVEEGHQDYYKKNPIRYKYYRRGCRRDARLQQIWGDEAGVH
jgi:peptide-methionine (S)-S-oxide reductase